MPRNGASTTAIIVAAGQGTRFGGSMPKQFLLLNGYPILAHTVQTFQSSKVIDDLIVVAGKQWLEYIRSEIVERFGIKKCRQILPGGEHRHDSVWEGLQTLDPKADGVVVVHDAVRPLFSKSLLERAVAGCEHYDGCIPALPLHDTVKQIDGEAITATVSRAALRLAQTPQAFRQHVLIKAYKAALQESFCGTDEAAFVERMHGRLCWIEGEEINLKITTSRDLQLAEFYLREKQTCV